MAPELKSDQLLVTEIFHSIQGEGSHVGIPYTFVRLTGCNLRCSYCDTAYAFKGGSLMSIEEITKRIAEIGCKEILLTGGEPLMQRPSAELCRRLVSEGCRVSIETHGEADISRVVGGARIIMDIKTPGSGMCRMGFEKNLRLLKPDDEIKFVITSKQDYEWAARLVRSGKLPTRTVLFSAANRAKGMPGNFEGVEVKWLAEKILSDRLDVRLQIQLHKLIWGPDQTGV